MMDWLHNGEGLCVFNLMGLSAPHAPKFAERVRRFADFYVPAEDNRSITRRQRITTPS